MVTFDSAAGGTLASVWRRDPRLSSAPALNLAAVKRLVVVAAHPDDETLGAGGLIATGAGLGIDVTVVVVTDGAASHPGSVTHDRHRLVSIRSDEVRRAVAALAPDARIVELGFADGGTRESRPDVSSRLREIFVGVPVTGTLLVAPWRGDGHRDHRVVGEVCAELAEHLGVALAEYPIWFWHWSTPSGDETPWKKFRVVALDQPARVAKALALRSFASQVSPLSTNAGDEALLTPRFLEHFDQPTELFFVEPTTLPAEYFDDLYERHDDPWGFATRWYERRKRAITMAALPEERYASVLEIGCSLGLLTLDLAERADRLLAVDISDAAVSRARERVTKHPNVTVEQRNVAESYPNDRYDLVVLSEVGYYLDPPALEALLAEVADSVTVEGTVVLCHWRHPVSDYPLSGDEVHAAMGMQSKLIRISHHEEKDFILDVYSLDPRSVAERTGLA